MTRPGLAPPQIASFVTREWVAVHHDSAKGRVLLGLRRAGAQIDEKVLCGRYVLTTSLDKDEVPAAQVARYYRSLQSVEHRFQVLKDSLELRPIFRWTEDRVRGQVALCVLAVTIEAVMAKDLVNAKVMDPDLPHLSVHDAMPGLVFVERRPPRARLGRRSQHRARQPAKPTPGQGAPGPPRRHLDPGQGHNLLNRAFTSRVVETLFPRDAIYLG